MNARTLVAAAMVVVGGVAAIGGCNSGTGDCPAKTSVVPGAACSDNDLQCAYDLSTPSPACDGTTTTIASSCTCSKGTWSCPSPIACAASEDAAPDGDAASDAAAPDSGAMDAPPG